MTDDIRKYDIVLIRKGAYAGTYGFVQKVADGKATVYVYDAPPVSDVREYALSSLTFVPPIQLTAEELPKLARFDTDVVAKIAAHPHADIETDAAYQMTIDDLEAALENIIASPMDGREIAMNWYYPVFDKLEEAFGIWDYVEGSVDTGEEDIPGVPNTRTVFNDVRYGLEDFDAWDYESASSLSQMLDLIRMHKRNQGKPLVKREFTQEQLEWFLKNWDNDRVALFGTPDIEALYVRAVDELAAADVPIGLHEKAYACYGKGNAGFEEDWVVARDCLLRLEEIAPKSQYADSLGYIYYYGHCTGGVPEYDKAFYWFSIGAAGGIYESRYKLADMIKDGKGCHQDREIAAHIIWDLYNENLGYFCRGFGRTKFADIALRAGHVWRDGINCRPSLDEAYRYYLMAKLAIRMRRQCCDAYGDESVERIIDEAIEGVLSETNYAKKADRVKASLWELLRFAVGYGRRVRMDWRRMSRDRYRLTFAMEDRPGTKYASKIPVLLPKAQFCGLLEKLAVTAEAGDVSGLEGERGSIVFDELGREGADAGALMLFGEKLARIDAWLSVDCRKIAGENRRYVSVSFGDPGRCRDYLCDDESVGVGSKVRVPYGKEVREGRVKRVTERFDCEIELPKKAYRRVLEAVEE